LPGPGEFSELAPPLPVDYKIWGVMQDWVYKKKVKDVNELRERLVEVWAGLQQNVIDE